MKNFTNNFKQFTSRLSARWLIMALMMLVGTGSAWAATLYLRGSFNGWGTGNQFVNNSCSITLNAGTYDFKIGSADWSVGYGNKGTMERTNCSGWKMDTGDNCHINADVTGTYTFEFNESTQILSVTYPAQCTTCCTNYYVAGDAGLCGEGWNVNADKMDCDDNVWTKKFTNVNNGTYYFQITNGTWDVKKGDYDNTKGNITLTNVDDGYGAKKIKLTTTSKGDITISFDGSKAWVTFENSCTSASYTVSFENNATSVNKGSKLQASVSPNGDGYGNVTWSSDVPDVATVNSSTGEITGVKGGQATITATVAQGTTYCGGSAPQIIKVKETPTVSISAKDNKTTLCGSEEATLKATVSGLSTSYTIKWYIEGNNNAVGTGSEYKTSNAGAYRVEVTGTYVNTTSSSNTITITKKNEPQKSNFSFSGETEFTYNGNVQTPTVNSEAGTITSTIYKLNGTLVEGPTNVGTYKVYVTTEANNTYCSATELEIGTFTINIANQTTPTITANSTNICGKEATFSVTGGDGTGDYSYSLDKNDAGVSLNGTTLTATQNGSVTLKVKKLGDANYNDSEEAVKMFNFTMPIENVNLSIIKGLSASGDYCVGTEIQLKLTYTGATPANDGSHLEWVKDGFSSEIGNNEGGIATGATWTTTLGVKDKTLKVKLKDCNGGWVESNELTFNVFERPSAPKFNTNYMTVCQGQAFTLPGSEAEGYIWSDATGKPTTPNKPNGIDATAEYKAVISFGCPSDATKFTVNVNPLPVPVISADLEAVNVGETIITLTVEGDNIENIEWYATDGTKEYNVTEITANQATITSDENAIITVTVTATSANGCVATATKDVTFGSENCEVSNADYVEILCRTSDGKRDMYCYAWKDGTTVELLGGYPGQKTKDGEFEYKGVKYAVWQIKTDSKIDVIFGNGTTKTGDITGLEKGKRYVYTLTNYNTATLKETASNIFVPEVKTISVVPVRQQNGTIKVSLSGKIMKKGCTNISSYGFQYKKVGGDYTNIEVGTTDQDAGFVYTKEFTIPNQQYGEYVFRARLVNANSTKVYGEEIHVYYYESDAYIAVVGDDYDVTNKDGVYYDFVGLYVKNVVIPSGATISSYEWQVKESSQWVTYNNGEATVADRGVTAASNNIRPNEAGEYRCVITLSNGTRLESNVIEIKSTATYDAEITATNRNLPVISVRTNVDFPTCETAGTTGNYPSTNIPGWKKKRSVDVKIFNADGSLYYDRKARMNYRGSSSLNFNKKSYAFCPGDENCGGEDGPDYVKTKKMNLFGLSYGAEDKDWVLYAASADPTLMRNRLVFDTYSEMTGKWGVNSMYVELVIDGKYQGVYVLMDKITNNTNRTYVGKYGNKDYTGGFIVKFDKTDIADRERSLLVGQELGDEKTFMTSRTGRLNIDTYHTKVDQLFEIEYPEKDDVEDEGESWSSVLGRIQQQFEEFETALANGDYIKVRSLIDYQSWADWFIINEFTKNVDAYRASCIFTYKGEGHKIEALPLWDQELSFNNAAGANIGKKGANVTNGLLIEHNGVYTDCFPAPFWFTGRTSNFNTCGTDGGKSTEGSKIENYLLKDECFVATIKERWKEHTKEDGALHKKQLTDKLALLVKELGAAKDREIVKWPSNHRVADACGGPGTGYNDIDYATSYTALENWIKGDLTSVNAENASYNRVTNLNYLINKMEGEPLLFDLTVNPLNGVTTPWIPVTITVEAPEGYEYTYDDSAIKAEKGVIIKHVGDKYSYTFPRPEAWPTGNVDTPIAPKFYEVEVKLNVSAVDNSCGGTFETDKKTTITLQDEGNDLCTYVEP